MAPNKTYDVLCSLAAAAVLITRQIIACTWEASACSGAPTMSRHISAKACIAAGAVVAAAGAVLLYKRWTHSHVEQATSGLGLDVDCAAKPAKQASPSPKTQGSAGSGAAGGASASSAPKEYVREIHLQTLLKILMDAHSSTQQLAASLSAPACAVFGVSSLCTWCGCRWHWHNVVRTLIRMQRTMPNAARLYRCVVMCVHGAVCGFMGVCTSSCVLRTCSMSLNVGWYARILTSVPRKSSPLRETGTELSPRPSICLLWSVISPTPRSSNYWRFASTCWKQCTSHGVSLQGGAGKLSNEALLSLTQQLQRRSQPPRCAG